MSITDVSESENSFGFYFNDCPIEFVSDSEYYEYLEDLESSDS